MHESPVALLSSASSYVQLKELIPKY